MALTAKIEIKDLGWDRIAKEMSEFKNAKVRVGIWGDEEVEGVSVADYAVYNEFGTRYIHSRPFMGRTADEKRDEFYDYASKLIGSVIDGSDARKALEFMGMWYQKEIQAMIRSAGSWAYPLLEETIKRKGSSSPLIDTGRMLNSVQYEVET